jgi:PAS domain S-box-containing protein
MDEEEILARFYSIINSSYDAIIGKDLNGVITSWNPAAEEIFGYTAQEAIGQSIEIIIPPDHLQEESDILQMISKGKLVHHFETVRRCKDGRLIDVSISASPILDHNRKVIGASKIARDITALKKAQALSAANKELTFQNEEKAKRAAELAIVNKQLATQNAEKAKLLDELVIANKEKAKRATELLASMKETLQAENAMLYSLNALSLARDNETGNHVIRTQFYVKVIASRLLKMHQYSDEINEKTINLMFKAAPLHDVGKVAIPDAILHKPGKLTDDEWVIMKTHNMVGEEILSSANHGASHLETVIGMAIKIAGGHHEHWDGSGYPRGLKNEAIPLPARVMAIADVYDALVSKRVYKKSWPHKQAIEYIISNSGTQFDPIIVHAFVLEEDNLNEIAQEYSDS